MKKVLFIAYLYPPIANSGTQRSVKFSNYLRDYGWEPIVLTVESGPDNTIESALLDEVRSNMRVERVSFLSKVVARRIASFFRFVIPESRMVEGLEWRLRGLWRFPDIYALWRPTAVKHALALFETEGFDCIYATGAPWTSFLVARDVARKTGKPFILDYRDLWTSWDSGWNNSSRIVRYLMRRQEINILRESSAVITVSDTLVAALRLMLTTDSNKIVSCITNGYDPVDFVVEPSKKIAVGKMRIVYTGVWKEGYSPAVLYEALQVLQNSFTEEYNLLEIVCAGFPPGPVIRHGLGKNIVELGQISHHEAIALMKSADFLFLPVASGDYALGSLPGKLFEYLGAGRPIIAAVPENSEVANVLNQTGGAVRIDPEDIAQLVEVLVSLVKAGCLDLAAPDASIVSLFERRHLAGKLAEVMESVTCS